MKPEPPGLWRCPGCHEPLPEIKPRSTTVECPGCGWGRKLGK